MAKIIRKEKYQAVKTAIVITTGWRKTSQYLQSKPEASRKVAMISNTKVVYAILSLLEFSS